MEPEPISIHPATGQAASHSALPRKLRCRCGFRSIPTRDARAAPSSARPRLRAEMSMGGTAWTMSDGCCLPQSSVERERDLGEESRDGTGAPPRDDTAGAAESDRLSSWCPNRLYGLGTRHRQRLRDPTSRRNSKKSMRGLHAPRLARRRSAHPHAECGWSTCAAGRCRQQHVCRCAGRPCGRTGRRLSRWPLARVQFGRPYMERAVHSG